MRHGVKPAGTKNQSGRIMNKRGQGATAPTKPFALTVKELTGEFARAPERAETLKCLHFCGTDKTLIGNFLSPQNAKAQGSDEGAAAYRNNQSTPEELPPLSKEFK